ncbi:MAG: 50S ribosomal protein L9 [Verrucomicrobia bacterium]|nr:50S ribosomal protein L9 [Cytophagales bacterium]
MEVILKEDIAGLGYKNDIVKVRPGYGRNYLIPQGFAVLASESNKKVRDENLKQVAHKAEKIKTEAQKLAESVGNMTLELKAKVGESGKIFGSVTTTQLAEALKIKGIDVDRKKISFLSEVKNLGEYEALLDLHKEVKHKVKFVVTGE